MTSALSYLASTLRIAVAHSGSSTRSLESAGDAVEPRSLRRLPSSDRCTMPISSASELSAPSVSSSLTPASGLSTSSLSSSSASWRASATSASSKRTVTRLSPSGE